MRTKLLDDIARLKIFTIDEIKSITKLKDNSIRVILSRLEDYGRIERIEKGKYIFIPLGFKKGEYTLNEFVIASKLVSPYAIAYWSALNFHSLTEQFPTIVFLQSIKKKKKSELNIFGIKYRFVTIKKEKFFGIEKYWIEGIPINVTDREKTVIDCLDKPRYSGGIIEVAKAFKSKELNTDKLMDYSIRMGSSAVLRRLGYLSEYFGIEINLPRPKFRNYLPLDPTMPIRGPKDPKWRLIININLGDLE